MPPTYPVFDGHNDALLRLSRAQGAAEDAFQAGPGHVTMEKARAGGFTGGFFAMFALGAVSGLDFSVFANPPYDTPLPEAIPREEAWAKISAQAKIAQDLEEAGLIRWVQSAADLTEAARCEALTGVLHLEGADCIGPDLEGLDTLHDLGLRSLGLVWSRPTIFAHGVPFRYPSTGDTGPGLTQEGRNLVQALKARGMVVDTSHITEKGFWDIAEQGVHLVATHSNAHGVCPTARNLTDAQLKAIGETNGMVGLNFGTMFLHPDGSAKRAGALDHMLPHLDHMLQLAGENHVGFGSDFDGAPMPEGLAHAGELPVLVARMEAAGYGSALINKITHQNWMACLERHLSSADPAIAP